MVQFTCTDGGHYTEAKWKRVCMRACLIQKTHLLLFSHSTPKFIGPFWVQLSFGRSYKPLFVGIAPDLSKVTFVHSRLYWEISYP